MLNKKNRKVILTSVPISMATGVLVQAHEPFGGSWPSDYARAVTKNV